MAKIGWLLLSNNFVYRLTSCVSDILVLNTISKLFWGLSDSILGVLASLSGSSKLVGRLCWLCLHSTVDGHNKIMQGEEKSKRTKQNSSAKIFPTIYIILVNQMYSRDVKKCTDSYVSTSSTPKASLFAPCHIQLECIFLFKHIVLFDFVLICSLNVVFMTQHNSWLL